MNGLIAIGYPNTMAANDALENLMDLQKQMLIQLDDAVIVERRGDGKVKLHQSGGSNTALGATGGALWGGLIGLLFLAPLLGMALGGGMGALAGHASDSGIDDNFMKDLGEQLQPGNAALVLLVHSATEDKVLAEMHGQHGGTILKTSLSADEEAQLRQLASRYQAAQ